MGQLSGVFNTSLANVVISDIGMDDWIAYDAANGFNRKSGGGAVIADVSALGAAVLGEVSSLGPSTMSWVGGTPDATGSQSGCLFASPDNAGDGGRTTVPADTTVRVVTLFLYSFSTDAQLVATLSDGSAAPITLVPTGAWSGSAFNCTITYQADSAGQTLQLDFTSTGTGSVPCWRGIALSTVTAPTPLLLYLLNEASSGTTPTTVNDTSFGTPLNLTQSGATWTSIPAGDGLDFSGVNSGALSTAIAGTKVDTGLAGCTKATWEVVANRDTNNDYNTLAAISGERVNGQFVVVISVTSAFDVYWADAYCGSLDISALSAGAHVFTVAVDTTQATGSDRVKLYVDGTFFGSYSLPPAQNTAISTTSPLFAAIACPAYIGIDQMFTGPEYYAALYANSFVPSPSAILSNATTLLANNDANPNVPPAPPVLQNAVAWLRA